MKSYTISWDGKLLGCQTLGDFQTDALHDGLKKAWKDFPFTVKFPEPNENVVTVVLQDIVKPVMLQD